MCNRRARRIGSSSVRRVRKRGRPTESSESQSRGAHYAPKRRRSAVPYKSDAQRKKFHAMEKRGEISPETVNEFDQASKGKKLPEHVRPKKIRALPKGKR
jgi:hypothetical protein